MRFNASYTRRHRRRRPENDIKSRTGGGTTHPLKAYRVREREGAGEAADSGKSIHKVVVIYDLLPFLICPKQIPSEAWQTLTCISYHIIVVVVVVVVSYEGTCNILLFYFNIEPEQTVPWSMVCRF